jgi:hypothetical protein
MFAFYTVAQPAQDMEKFVWFGYHLNMQVMSLPGKSVEDHNGKGVQE